MIPQAKPSKSDIKFVKKEDTVAYIMAKYLKGWGVKTGKEEAFIAAFVKGMADMALSGERVILPHNLGYIQGLEHLYEGKDKNHLMKFGNLDYSICWIKHPLFFHHKIIVDKALNEQAKVKKKEGVKYLNDYVDGDFYVA